MKKRGRKKIIDCSQCKSQSDCCMIGAWIDLEEAKKILDLKLKGDFFHLEKDDCFPSGYKVGTSYEDDPCSFLGKDGLCPIHKIGYHLKPVTCKEFPYEDNKLSSFAGVLCTLYKTKRKNKNKRKRASS